VVVTTSRPSEHMKLTIGINKHAFKYSRKKAYTTWNFMDEPSSV
jgi:hypothetical protein